MRPASLLCSKAKWKVNDWAAVGLHHTCRSQHSRGSSAPSSDRFSQFLSHCTSYRSVSQQSQQLHHHQTHTATLFSSEHHQHNFHQNSHYSHQKRNQRERQTLNIGRATDILQQDLPNYFEPGTPLSGLSDTTIYSKNITFSDPFHLKNLIVKGRLVYLSLSGLLRSLCLLYYQDPYIEIVRMVQIKGPVRKENLDDVYHGEWGRHGPPIPDDLNPPTPPPPTPPPQEDRGAGNGKRAWRRSEKHDVPDENIRLVVRWVFEGTPRHQLIMPGFMKRGIPRPTVYEGVFVYRFDEDGLIDNHRLQSIYPSPPLLAFCKWFKRDDSAAPREGLGVPTPM